MSIPIDFTILLSLINCSTYRAALGQNKKLSISGLKLWNSIPINIKNSSTIVTLKNHLYKLFL